MPFAIIQTELTPPPIDRLRQALCVLPSLTKTDAACMARDAFGVLMNGLSWQDASVLQGALLGEGIATEIVDQQELLTLPPPKRLTKAVCLPQCLLVHDPLGKEMEIGWRHIVLVASGNVRLSEFKFINGAPGPADKYSAPMNNTRHREEQRHEMIVEVLLDAAPARFHVAVRDFNYQIAKQSLRSNFPERYICFVRDLLRFAPEAILNRGAESAKKDPPSVLRYPTKHAFEEEIVWLLWRYVSRR